MNLNELKKRTENYIKIIKTKKEFKLEDLSDVTFEKCNSCNLKISEFFCFKCHIFLCSLCSNPNSNQYDIKHESHCVKDYKTAQKIQKKFKLQRLNNLQEKINELNDNLEILLKRELKEYKKEEIYHLEHQKLNYIISSNDTLEIFLTKTLDSLKIDKIDEYKIMKLNNDFLKSTTKILKVLEELNEAVSIPQEKIHFEHDRIKRFKKIMKKKFMN